MTNSWQGAGHRRERVHSSLCSWFRKESFIWKACIRSQRNKWLTKVPIKPIKVDTYHQYPLHCLLSTGSPSTNPLPLTSQIPDPRVSSIAQQFGWLLSSWFLSPYSHLLSWPSSESTHPGPLAVLFLISTINFHFHCTPRYPYYLCFV